MEGLNGNQLGQLRRAERIVIEPAAVAEARMRLWVRRPNEPEARERQILVSQQIRGLDRLPPSVQLSRVEGVTAWQNFVRTLQVGDRLHLEWTAEAGTASSQQASPPQWSARLAAQRDVKEVAQFVIRASGGPSSGQPRPGPSGGRPAR